MLLTSPYSVTAEFTVRSSDSFIVCNKFCAATKVTRRRIATTIKRSVSEYSALVFRIVRPRPILRNPLTNRRESKDGFSTGRQSRWNIRNYRCWRDVNPYNREEYCLPRQTLAAPKCH